MRISNWRWWICSLLFIATTVNYLDRQVLSLTWKDFIAPEFHWNDNDYGNITATFSIFYAFISLFAGRFIDWLGTKKGYIWAIVIWSFGACLHAACGWATMRLTGIADTEALYAVEKGSELALLVSTTSVWLFLACRIILATGESGNFPAAIKVTAEYFPKKDRAYATSIFNAGASVGALVAPLTIPLLAKHLGWEMAFIIIGGIGFLWAGLWQLFYTSPDKSRFVNAAELAYINQADEDPLPAPPCRGSVDTHPQIQTTPLPARVAREEGIDSMSIAPSDRGLTPKPRTAWQGGGSASGGSASEGSSSDVSLTLLQCFRYRQTWAFIVGKLMTDGVWWFFLFWAPAYFSELGYPSSSGMGQALIFVLYLIVTLLSICGGYLPKLFVERRGMDPYAGRMRAMLIFAFLPIFAMFAQPLASISPWWPCIIIGLAGAGHQAWSANLYSTIGDMFPKSAIATITGIGTMFGGLCCFAINKASGVLFTYAEGQGEAFTFFGATGKPAGYMMVFCYCAVAYLLAWVMMKTLVPRYKKIEI